MCNQYGCGEIVEICHLLWENRPNCQLLPNESEARKVAAVDDPTIFYKKFKSQHSGQILKSTST